MSQQNMIHVKLSQLWEEEKKMIAQIEQQHNDELDFLAYGYDDDIDLSMTSDDFNPTE